jgi:putative serine protease PepD
MGKDLAAVRVSRMLPVLEVSQTLPGIGAAVLVLGSPEGLEGTVASGVVSAIRGQFIQFSAPVSPGDSGGPLVDDQGRVLGVIVSKIEATGAEGLSFAIPIATACQTVLDC